jgi:hypothetical protein
VCVCVRARVRVPYADDAHRPHTKGKDLPKVSTQVPGAAVLVKEVSIGGSVQTLPFF